MRLRSRVVAYASATAIALAGHRARALDPRAAAVASLIGGAVIDGFGGRGALLLGFFFTSGSGLSRLPASRRSGAGQTARNFRQVLANGGVAALAGIASGRRNGGWSVAAMAGSLAAATSDTWATEIGLQYGGRPRYVISGASIAPGLSGGITTAGTLASAAGALALAGLAGSLYRDPWLVPAVAAGGLSGSVVDSVLGELVQVKRQAAVGGALTEAREIGDQQTTYASGWQWFDNDAVNFACTLTGGVVAAVLWGMASDRR